MAGPLPVNYYPRVDAEIIVELRPALWLAAMGLLVIFIDLTFGSLASGSAGAGWEPPDGRIIGWQLDLLHDSLGYLLVLLALGHLRRAPAPEHAKRFIPHIAIVMMVGVGVSLIEVLVGWKAGLLGFLFALFQAASGLALLGFLWTVKDLCRAAMEYGLERAWRHAILAAGIVWVAPVVLGALASAFLVITSRPPVVVQAGSSAPVCAALVVLSLPLAWLGAAFVRTTGWSAPPRLETCHVCGYPVANLPRPQCPECGTLFATERGSSRPGDLGLADETSPGAEA